MKRPILCVPVNSPLGTLLLSYGASMFSSVRLFFVVQLFTSALATTYHLSDSIQGDGFLSKFNVESISDPTNGRVLVYSPSPSCIIAQLLTPYFDPQQLCRFRNCRSSELDLRLKRPLRPARRFGDRSA